LQISVREDTTFPERDEAHGGCARQGVPGHRNTDAVRSHQVLPPTKERVEVVALYDQKWSKAYELFRDELSTLFIALFFSMQHMLLFLS
jgi:hypothetical protein